MKRMIEEMLIGTIAIGIAVLALMFVLSSKASGSGSSSIASGATIVITTQNSVTLKGEVNPESIAKVIKQLYVVSNSSKQSDVIYLVLDTPGGHVGAGLALIDAVHGLPQRVKTISIFAASMGFHIVQSLDERLITANGTLMSHRVRAGVSGQAPGELNTRIADLMRLITRLDTIVAKRMDMSLSEYQELVRDEYWVSGEDAVAQKAADRVVNVRCGADLLFTETQTVRTLFGDIEVQVSGCPLIP